MLNEILFHRKNFTTGTSEFLQFLWVSGRGDANQRKIIIIIIYNKIKDIQIQSAFCLKIQNYMRKH